MRHFVTVKNRILIKIISSILFIVIFFLICGIFELIYPRSVTNNINRLIDNILFFGLK